VDRKGRGGTRRGAISINNHTEYATLWISKKLFRKKRLWTSEGGSRLLGQRRNFAFLSFLREVNPERAVRKEGAQGLTLKERCAVRKRCLEAGRTQSTIKERSQGVFCGRL